MWLLSQERIIKHEKQKVSDNFSTPKRQDGCGHVDSTKLLMFLISLASGCAVIHKWQENS
jgi:hypothetical protein